MPVSSLPSRRTTRIGLIVGAACTLGIAVAPAPAGAGAGPSGTSSSGSPTAAVQQALAAATEAGSAQIAVQFFSGTTTGKVLQDSSLRTGKQTVAIGNERASVEVTGGTAYISGNDTGLTSFFGLPNALLPEVTGRWISVQPTDSAFQSIAANVTLPSALAEVKPSVPLVAGKKVRVHGQWAKTVSGTGPNGTRITLFVASAGRPLPLEAVETSGSGSTRRGEIVTFTHWGEQVHVVKPGDVIPISVLEAATPQQG
jgi:hypothetical protein